jgi:SacI homology domain
MVEFVAIEHADLSGFRQLNSLQVHGTLGLITIENDVFLCVITGANRVANVRPGETVNRIHAVEFCKLKSFGDATCAPANLIN